MGATEGQAIVICVADNPQAGDLMGNVSGKEVSVQAARYSQER